MEMDDASQMGSFKSFCSTKVRTNRMIHKNISSLDKMEEILKESQHKQSFVAPMLFGRCITTALVSSLMRHSSHSRQVYSASQWNFQRIPGKTWGPKVLYLEPLKLVLDTLLAS